MKIMPLMHEFKKYPKRIKYTLVHTGQHYDMNMSKSFFKDLDIPKPDIFLNIGSGTHGIQTAKVIEGIEEILLKKQYDLLIVVGDVNSTIAAALAASKLGVKIAHIEAGLRSFDRGMPEEINRVLTDHISDYLFTTEACGNKNLEKEGIDKEKIFFVGDIMIDSHKMNKARIDRSKIIDKLRLAKGEYCLVTVHRPSNVDQKKDLKRIAGLLRNISHSIEVVFPVHPRTKKMLKAYKVKTGNIRIIDPLGYIDFQALLKGAKLILTDSGGIQEEATVCNIPCLTLRENTERPVTIAKGSNELVGSDKEKALKAVEKIINNKWKKAAFPPLWDGNTAKRVIKIILKKEKQICKKN
jgi:UDP-N-acetylglucosamine 2-epimerase (non-hydrolysing)